MTLLIFVLKFQEIFGFRHLLNLVSIRMSRLLFSLVDTVDKVIRLL